MLSTSGLNTYWTVSRDNFCQRFCQHFLMQCLDLILLLHPLHDWRVRPPVCVGPYSLQNAAEIVVPDTAYGAGPTDRLQRDRLRETRGQHRGRVQVRARVCVFNNHRCIPTSALGVMIWPEPAGMPRALHLTVLVGPHKLERVAGEC